MADCTPELSVLSHTCGVQRAQLRVRALVPVCFQLFWRWLLLHVSEAKGTLLVVGTLLCTRHGGHLVGRVAA
jgi:hypothetical protein